VRRQDTKQSGMLSSTLLQLLGGPLCTTCPAAVVFQKLFNAAVKRSVACWGRDSVAKQVAP